MNDNSIQINSYLQHEMSEAERIAFEDRLITDASLKQELQAQQQVMEAITNAGIRNEFSAAIRKRVIIKRSVTWATIIAAASVVTLLVYNFRGNFFTNKSSIDNIAGQPNNGRQPFINPPLPAIDVPFSEYSFDAEKGDTIFYPSGSVIYFPPSALVDGKGDPVKGTVKVTYREFADPLDFFVSGIPMSYDSAGVSYNFESSGMCEINAYKDNEAVFVNQRAKPQINLSVNNKDPLHNLYFLDTATRNWEFRGKDSITAIKNTVRFKDVPTGTLSFQLPQKPVMPRKASDDHQAFSIEIEPGSFEELFAYDRQKFEVVDESNYKRSDANEQWETVKLERTAAEGIYNVTFANSKRKVSYKVRPVLEAADYDAALKVFNQKNIAYEQALQNREISDRQRQDSITRENKRLTENRNADKDWNDKMNAMIDARNKAMRALKRRAISDMEKATIMQQQTIQDELLLLNRNEWKQGVDRVLSTEIMRTFAVSGFGIWNCDKPLWQEAVPLFSNYTNNAGNKIDLLNVAVVNKNINGISGFATPTQIRIIPGQENMIWGILDSSFYYFTYKDFAAAGIQKDTKSFTFNMRKAAKTITSYFEIRELIDQL